MDNHRIEVVENVVNGRQSVQWVAAKLDRCGKDHKKICHASEEKSGR